MNKDREADLARKSYRVEVYNFTDVTVMDSNFKELLRWKSDSCMVDSINLFKPGYDLQAWGEGRLTKSAYIVGELRDEYQEMVNKRASKYIAADNRSVAETNNGVMK